MADSSYVAVIRVNGEFKDGGWFITSENLPGLFLAGRDPKALHADLPAVIKTLYKLNYEMDVEVCPAGEPGEGRAKSTVLPRTWAAVPVEHRC